MNTKRNTDLIGILIGNIMHGAHPLCIYLYADGADLYHTRVVEHTDYVKAETSMLAVSDSFQGAILNVWINDFRPPWFYIQFIGKPRPAPILHSWSLPWTVHQNWRVTTSR